MLFRRQVSRMISMFACLALVCALWSPAGLRVTAYSQEIESGEQSVGTTGLEDVTIPGYALEPEFDPAVTEYVITVPHEVMTLTVFPAVSDGNVTVWLDNSMLEGDSLDVQLDRGDVSFTLTVYADQQTPQTYTFHVNRPSKTYVVNETVDTQDANPGDGNCADAENRCTLRAAIMEANKTWANDTISVLGGTYYLTLQDQGSEWDGAGDLDVTAPLTISGAGAESTVIDATAVNDRVFLVSSPYFHLSGVSITAGSASGDGGGVKLQGKDGEIASYTIQDTVFVNNWAENGAALMATYSEVMLDHVTFMNHDMTMSVVYIDESASLNAQNLVFQENGASSGGAISNYGYAQISVAEFIDNVASSGGAIYNDGDMVISDSVFEGNEAYAGGAIYNNRNLNIQGSVFESNKADEGGVIYNDPEGVMEIVDSEFTSNLAGYGGAVDNYGSLEISDSRFANNRAVGEQEPLYDAVGGAIRNQGPLVLTRIELSGNQTDGNGGAIISGMSLTITDSYIHDNSAAYGGGLYLLPDGSLDNTVSITRTTFSSNSAVYTGGGASLHQSVIISNSTFTDNEAGSGATGLEFSANLLVLSHTTIADNLLTNAGSGQGGQGGQGGGQEPAGSNEVNVTVNESGSFIVSNSIIGGSDSGPGTIQVANCDSLTLLGTNIIRGSICDVPEDNEHIIDVDPMLAPLMDNGGYVPTRALLPGSTAIDAGRMIEASDLNLTAPVTLELFNPYEDQRGEPRSESGFEQDIGAYEFPYAPYTMLSYYDASEGLLHVRFGAKLITDETIAPLAIEQFQVTADAGGAQPQQRLVGIEAVYYGDDDRSIVLDLTEVEETESLSIMLGNNAVKFANEQPGENQHAFKRTDSVVTPLKLRDALLEDRGEDERPLHIGDIVRALAKGSLTLQLGDFHDDPAVVRYLMSLIRPQYVEID